MTSFKIPGVVGSGITLCVNDGKWISATSRSLGPVGFEDYIFNWARREIRRGVSNGLHLAGEVAYKVAIHELRALENDLSAKLRLIANLPAGLRERVAYEVFAAFFDHYLPKKFLRHYVWGKGTALTLTLQEMIDCNPLITLLRSKSFRELLVQATKQSGMQFPFEVGVLSGALTNGTLGQFTAKIKGTLIAGSGSAWDARGTMSFFDEWDFDPKDFSTGGRSFQGEVKTRIANAWLPGEGFKIFSAITEFTQDQSNNTVVWAGGTPKGEPDRIAALDVELSAADK